ncbi:hypothetical protein BN1088_1433265 [Sphingobacterium sp. PM2-P1-29]|nr:hypothetical protein BN1088_1433265 [Sphingobacterium sp. PM2-P1-29]
MYRITVNNNYKSTFLVDKNLSEEIYTCSKRINACFYHLQT